MQNEGLTAGLRSVWNLKWQMQGCFSLANQLVTEMEYLVPDFQLFGRQDWIYHKEELETHV